MSPSSPGVPGGEPEPAHPYQQRLGAVSDPVPLGIPSRPPHGAAGAVHHPAQLTWPGTVPSARRGDGGAGTAGLRPHIRCTLGLIPIPLPRPRRVGWRGCSRVCRWGRAWSPTPGGSAGPCPSVGAVSRDATCPGRWGVLGHRGLLAPRPPSADTAASIPSWLFIFRIPWQGCDCKQLIFSQGHLHPMAVPRSHRGVAGCPVPPGDVAPRCGGTVGPRTPGGLAGSCGHPGSALRCPQVPARVGGDAQSYRGEGAGASGGGPRCSGER